MKKSSSVQLSHNEGGTPSHSDRCIYRITNPKKVTAFHREEVSVHGRTIISEVDSGASVSLTDANLVSPSDIIPGKTLTIEGVGRQPFEVQVACLSSSGGTGDWKWR